MDVKIHQWNATVTSHTTEAEANASSIYKTVSEILRCVTLICDVWGLGRPDPCRFACFSFSQMHFKKNDLNL